MTRVLGRTARRTAALALEVGAIEATIAGTTTDGRASRGTDVVRVTPQSVELARALAR